MITRFSIPTILAVALLAQAPNARAAEPKPAEKKKAGKPHDPTDLNALRSLLGETITVEGPIVSTGENKNATIRFLNFTKDYRSGLVLVFFLNYSEGSTFSKEKLQEYIGKKVRVTGKLEEYGSTLQFKIDNLSQIEVIE
jgi:DNA/RNA endonuclease YhcR with UshA esterase domain